MTRLCFLPSHTPTHTEVNNFNHDGDTLKELREIIERLGGWPLLDDKVAWNDSKWSLEATIEDIRKHLLNRTDEIFNITSFIIHIQHANNVRNVFIQFPIQTHTFRLPHFLFGYAFSRLYDPRNHIHRLEKRIVNTLGKLPLF